MKKPNADGGAVDEETLRQDGGLGHGTIIYDFDTPWPLVVGEIPARNTESPTSKTS